MYHPSYRSFVFPIVFLVVVMFGTSFERVGAQFFPTDPLPPGGVATTNNSAWTGVGRATGATLVKQIYDLHQIPFAWYSQTSPFRTVTYLTGGRLGGDFVVAGPCSPRLTSSYAPSEVARMNAFGSSDNNIHIQGGLYVFSEEGDLISRRNACRDGGLPGPLTVPAWQLGCNELGACETVPRVIPTGEMTFVREMMSLDYYGKNRPPVEYRVVRGEEGLRRVGLAYQVDFNWIDTPGRMLIGNLVPARGSLVGLKQQIEDVNPLLGRTITQSNVVLASSGLSELSELSVPYIAPTGAVSGSGQTIETEQKILPLAGAGNFVLGSKSYSNGGRYDTTPYVFKLTNNDELEQVGTLSGFANAYAIPAYDPTNTNRVGFHIGGTIQIFEATSTGLTLFQNVTLPDGQTNRGSYGAPDFAIQGDTIAYIYHPEYTVLPVSGTMADPYRGATVRVMRGGSPLAEISLPKFIAFDRTGDPIDDLPMSVGLSPKGDIVIGSHFGALYLYKLGGNTGGNTPPTGTTTPGVNIPNIPDNLSTVNGYLDFAAAYLRLLFGTMAPGSVPLTSPAPNTSGMPSLEDVYNQAQGYLGQ